MSASDEILSQIPMAALAAKLGVDEKQAEQAARQAIPALLGGMHANAQDSQGAESLSRAIGKHDSGLVDGGVDLGQVDTAEGKKIVRHVFGANEDQVVSRLGTASAGGDKGLVAKLLPLLAPIVMSWLAKKFAGGGSVGTGGRAATQHDSGGLGGLGDLLGGLLGAKGAGSQGGLGGGLGDLLGGLLGGGRR